MAEKTVTINNAAGIHCRPSSVILSEVQKYPDNQFLVKSDNGESDLSSILGLLGLGLQQGNQVSLSVSGPNEEEVCETLAELFEKEFDFPPK